MHHHEFTRQNMTRLAKIFFLSFFLEGTQASVMAPVISEKTFTMSVLVGLTILTSRRCYSYLSCWRKKYNPCLGVIIKRQHFI